MENKNNSGLRVFANGCSVSNDTRETGLNNNDLIIGPSGSGKTGGYAIPTMLGTASSMIIADTKGNLARTYGDYLRGKGFKVFILDFVNPEVSCGYNPLSYIRKNVNGHYSEMDIKTIANVLVPQLDGEEPFWEMSARVVLETLIAYVLEFLPENEHNLASVVEVYRLAVRGASVTGMRIFEEASVLAPESITAKKYDMFKGVIKSDRTFGCISQFLTTALNAFYVDEIMEMLQKNGFRIEEIGRAPTVLFVNISDSDRSLDGLVNIFYTQCLQVLIREADKNEDNRLKVPVRIMLDDFAANTYIPDFDNIVSIIRSREISVSIILQSLTQLNAKYGYYNAQTIVNNCDHILYLGGSDRETCEYVANRMGLTPERVLYLPLDKAIVLARGSKGVLADKIQPYSFAAFPTVTGSLGDKSAENRVDSIENDMV